MNKELNPEKVAATMRQFEQQNARMEMTDEMSESIFFRHSLFSFMLE